MIRYGKKSAGNPSEVRNKNSASTPVVEQDQDLSRDLYEHGCRLF